MLERLQKDFKQSLVDKDVHKKNIVQMLRANIINLAKEKRVSEKDLSEEEIILVISRELKQQNDSLIAFRSGNREDLAKDTEIKIEILKSYLPKQLEESEIKEIILETLKELDIDVLTNKDKGNLMKALMPKVKGKADGKLVNTIVQDLTVK